MGEPEAGQRRRVTSLGLALYITSGPDRIFEEELLNPDTQLSV